VRKLTKALRSRQQIDRLRRAVRLSHVIEFLQRFLAGRTEFSSM